MVPGVITFFIVVVFFVVVVVVNTMLYAKGMLAIEDDSMQDQIFFPSVANSYSSCVQRGSQLMVSFPSMRMLML